MSIMEKNLPIAESLGEGDKLRIVTSEGNSKQIDASEIGGGVLIVKQHQDGYIYTLDKTYREIREAMNNGMLVMVVSDNASSRPFISPTVVNYCGSNYDGTIYEVYVGIFALQNGTRFIVHDIEDYPYYDGED